MIEWKKIEDELPNVEENFTKQKFNAFSVSLRGSLFYVLVKIKQYIAPKVL